MPPGLRLPAFLAAAVTLAYLGAFRGVFQFDDFKVIVDEPTVHSLAAWLADLGHGIRPVLKLSYLLNWLTGPGEAGFHALNLAVHAANVLLAFALARRLARAHGLEGDDGARAALVAALLFGLHPAQTEAVTYISGRSASLMAFFYLGGLAAYAAPARDSGRRVLLLALSLACFALAVATKESAVTFPLALLWWEACQPGAKDWRAIARRQAAHWALLAAIAALLAAHPLYGTRLAPALDPESLRRNALSQVDAIAYLVLRLVRPWPLNIDPDLRVATEWNLTLAAEAALLAAGALGAALSFRRRPWWGLAAAWFVLQLLPTNSILPRADLANDRHLYLAGLGFFVAAGVEIARAGPARRRLWPAALFVIGLLAAGTVARNGDFASEVALWEQTARVSPGKPRVHNNLGHAYSRAGRRDLAEAAYREALRLHPGYELARDNLDVITSGRARRESGAP